MARRQLNYSTAITARRTVAECHDLLADAGAAAIGTVLEDAQPVGLTFQLRTPGGVQTYRLPVNHEGVHAQLQVMTWPASAVKSGAAKRGKTEQHALDVAWRVAKDWLEAQLAIIAAEMVSLDEVMLPYLQVEAGVTLYQALSSGRAALTTGGE